MLRTPLARPAGDRVSLSRLVLATILAVLAGFLPYGPAMAGGDIDSLAVLSLEQLGDIQVTSVLKRSERLADAPASIYVITGEEIRRSGATSLPEALRLAPNLEVARADAVQYAITMRGFNSVLENKLLVMIDGRTVYSPLFSGVFWEAQDIALANIERIEVVSGPGGTLWGTNAVNGVINIILRSAEDTKGLLVSGGGGDRDRNGTLRYGARLGSAGSYRLTGNVSEREHSERANGTELQDGATMQRAGFHSNWAAGPNQLAFDGKAYRGDIQQGATKRRITGVDLLGRWERNREGGTNTRAQVYFDFTGRDQPGAIRDNLHTFDFEFQQGVRPFVRNEVLWGAGYRYEPDNVENLAPATLAFIPASRILRFANAFIQDNVTLAPRLSLIAGIKGERNDITDAEYLPSVRLAWKPMTQGLVWAAASRAVRAPSRIDRELYLPGTVPHFVLDGGPNFESEIANVLELGVRMQQSTRMSYSISGFHHMDSHLRSLELTPTGPVFGNTLEATNTGVEAWGNYQLLEHWRVSAGMVQQKQVRRRSSGSKDIGGLATLGNDPTQWWTFRSSLDVGPDVQFDVMVREVGGLPQPHVPGYTAVDMRLGWKLMKGLELAVSGQNLFDAEHPEWGVPAARPVFERALYGSLQWRR